MKEVANLLLVQLYEVLPKVLLLHTVVVGRQDRV